MTDRSNPMQTRAPEADMHPDERSASLPGFGDILREVTDLGGGLAVMLLPLVVTSLPGIVLFLIAPVLLLLALAAVPLVLAAIVAAPPYVLYRLARRRTRDAPPQRSLTTHA